MFGEFDTEQAREILAKLHAITPTIASVNRYAEQIRQPKKESKGLTPRGHRVKPMGLDPISIRLSKRSAVHVTPHLLRRTFVILSLRNGMDVLHLQAMLEHAGLDMVQYYAQMVDEDLSQAYHAYSPIEGLVAIVLDRDSC